MNTLNGIFGDPNVVYLALVFGLWVAVTAAYVPGTGVIEGIALIGVGGAFLALLGMPTNWVAVLALVIGVLSFLVIPFVNSRLARLAEAGLILQVIGGLFLFNKLTVSWVLVAMTVAMALAYHHLALLPLLRRARQQATIIDDDNRLVGMTGRMVNASEPFGTTYVGSANINGEQWTAYSDAPLSRGDVVRVIEREGLQLYVEMIKNKQTPQHESEG